MRSIGTAAVALLISFCTILPIWAGPIKAQIAANSNAINAVIHHAEAWPLSAGSRISDQPPAPQPVPAPAGNQSPAPTLQAYLQESLLTYHRVGNRTDGSTLTGIQMPPFTQITLSGSSYQVTDEASLTNYANRLAAILAQEMNFDYNPSPTDPASKAAFRQNVAAQAAEAIKTNAKSQFMAMTTKLHNPELQQFVNQSLTQAQPQFWDAPSSSSGKYHPADEINYAGLLVHTMRDVEVGEALCRIFGLPDHRHELVRAALILHDVDKGGIPWATNVHTGQAPDSGYAPNHGPIAAGWLEQFEPACGSDCDSIIQDIHDHMAQWNAPTPTPPTSLEEQIVSYADYVGSLSDVYVPWQHANGPASPTGVSADSQKQ